MGHDDVAAGFALEGGYLLGEVAAGNPGAGPFGGWQRRGEDDLGKFVHEPRVVASRGRSVPGHLLVGDASHDVGSGLAQGCDLPCAYVRMLGRKPPVTFAARPGNVPVQRDAHLQDHSPHQNSLLEPFPCSLICRRGLTWAYASLTFAPPALPRSAASARSRSALAASP